MSVDRNRSKYYADVQVGKDMIENAEFVVFSVELADRPKRIKMRKDSIGDLWWNIKAPFRRFKGKCSKVYWNIRYGFQRMFKGYDSVDCFETFAKFTERYSKILTQYKNTHWGYPYKVSSDEWDNIIDEMIYHLHYMNEDNVTKELMVSVPENCTPSLKTTSEILNKHKDEFFKLFSKYFFDLWD